MRTMLLIVLVAMVAPLVVHSFKCRPCGTYQCDPPPTNCLHGHVTDACNCCTVCAKGPGDECGGPSDVRGKCKQGLGCVRPPGSQSYDDGHCESLAPGA